MVWWIMTETLLPPQLLLKMSLLCDKFSSLVAIVNLDMVWQYNNLIKSSLIFLRKNREKSFILSYDSSTGKSYDGFSKNSKHKENSIKLCIKGRVDLSTVDLYLETWERYDLILRVWQYSFEIISHKSIYIIRIMDLVNLHYSYIKLFLSYYIIEQKCHQK